MRYALTDALGDGFPIDKKPEPQIVTLAPRDLADWPDHDDQPLPLRVRSGRLISIPYSMDINDSIIYRQQFEGAEFAQMARDAFDVLYAEGAEGARVMCIAIHPYMMGQPHRVKHLDEALKYILGHDGVWAATGEEIADWYLENCHDHYAAHIKAAN